MTPSFLTAILSVLIFLVSCSQSPGDNLSDSISTKGTISRAALLSASCSGCHDSKSVVGDVNTYASHQIYEQLVSYREDNGSTVMHRLMRGYSTEDIRLLSEYLGQTAVTKNE